MTCTPRAAPLAAAPGQVKRGGPPLGHGAQLFCISERQPGGRGSSKWKRQCWDYSASLTYTGSSLYFFKAKQNDHILGLLEKNVKCWFENCAEIMLQKEAKGLGLIPLRIFPGGFGRTWEQGSQKEFLSHGAIDILHRILLCWGCGVCCPVHYGMFSLLLDLCLLGDSNTPPGCNSQKLLQILSNVTWRTNLPSWEQLTAGGWAQISTADFLRGGSGLLLSIPCSFPV